MLFASSLSSLSPLFLFFFHNQEKEGCELPLGAPPKTNTKLVYFGQIDKLRQARPTNGLTTAFPFLPGSQKETFNLPSPEEGKACFTLFLCKSSR